MVQARSLADDLKRGWWLIAAAILLSVLMAAGLTATTEPTFGARATWVVVPNTRIEDPSDILRSLETLERRTIVATFARLPGTRSARNTLEQRLELETRALSAYSLRGTIVPYTNLIRFEVEGPDSEMAARAANGLARQIRSEVRSMYRLFTIREVESARASSRPLRPDWRRNLVVGALIGLFIGAGLAVLTAFRKEGPAATTRPGS